MRSYSVDMLPTLDDLDPAGKKILVRVDYNVPLKDGQVADDSRIEASLPTVRELADRGGAVVLMSHLGRPQGIDESLRMGPVGKRLGEMLGQTVWSMTDLTGPGIQAAASGLAPGEVMLLENLRFDPGEKANAPELASELAGLAEAYVNDAFGTAHRSAASTVGVAELLPAFAGRLMAKELEVLGGLLEDPLRPFVLVMGGAKISDKLGVIGALLPKADAVLIGGGMANTFLAARGIGMGDSLVEEDRLDDARQIEAEAGERLVVPADLVVADGFSADAATRIVSADDGVPEGWLALDVGPKTTALFAERFANARTLIWNGPVGVFEMEAFAQGTFALAEAISGLADATTVVGGGDSAAAVRAAGLADRVTWLSTGGGAMLRLLEGRSLPAVDVLLERK